MLKFWPLKGKMCFLGLKGELENLNEKKVGKNYKCNAIVCVCVGGWVYNSANLDVPVLRIVFELYNIFKLKLHNL